MCCNQVMYQKASFIFSIELFWFLCCFELYLAGSVQFSDCNLIYSFNKITSEMKNYVPQSIDMDRYTYVIVTLNKCRESKQFQKHNWVGFYFSKEFVYKRSFLSLHCHRIMTSQLVN